MASILKLIISFAYFGICFHPSFAQSYSMKYIFLKTDTTLRANIGERITVEYRIRNCMTSYQYKKGKSGKIKEEKLKTYNKPTKGNFCGGEIIYQFYFTDKHDIGWKNFLSPVETVRLDANFNPVTPLKIRGIPQYILNNDTTKFVTYEQAIQMIKDRFPFSRNSKEIQEHYRERSFVPYLELYLEPIIEYSARLHFDKKKLKHYWRVSQIINCGEVSGYIESIEEKYMEKYGHLYRTKDLRREFCIDAITGEILVKGNFESVCCSPCV